VHHDYPLVYDMMLLPGEEENWDDMRETSSSKHTFPSGNYQFLVGYEPDIGKYQMCSLFSPMFEFTCNDAAVETAEIVIKELMNIENVEEADIDSTQLEAIWDGTEEHPDKIAAREAAAKAKAEAPPRKPFKERMNEPVSRRRLLRGALMLEDDEKTVTASSTDTKITNKSQHD
jgi:[NiFe] hydrogenase assembly HybE family chaperone